MQGKEFASVMRRVIIASLICSSLGIAGAHAAAKMPSDILDLRLGMSEEQVRSRLAKIATQQKEEKTEAEEEGEQEVWILKKHPELNYLLVRFNSEHRLVLVTAVVHQPSKVRYGDLADLKFAEMKTDGRNYAYTWKIPSKKGRRGYAVVARGSDPQYLNSYSLYRLR